MNSRPKQPKYARNKNILVIGGSGSGNGSATANFMKDLIKSLPAMHDLASQAGIELPRILGKVEDCVNAPEIIQEGTVSENAQGQKVVLCPHCEAKYKAKDENGKISIVGFGDVDENMEGQQIYCIKCGTKFSVPESK